MATNIISARAQESKRDFAVAVAAAVRRAIPRFSATESVEAAQHILFLLANPHLNPLRAKAIEAGLL